MPQFCMTFLDLGVFNLLAGACNESPDMIETIHVPTYECLIVGRYPGRYLIRGIHLFGDTVMNTSRIVMLLLELVSKHRDVVQSYCIDE